MTRLGRTIIESVGRRKRNRLRRWVSVASLLALAFVLHRTGCSWLSLEPGFERSPSTYDRDDWQHWIDADHDCQDTRQEVLIAESEIPVEFADRERCKVTRGRWRCPYTGHVFTDPRMLDVDHLVPLRAAHDSGGQRWTRAQRRRYANDLEDADHLVAVSAAANRAKGHKSPAQWLPSRGSHRCEYVRDWTRVKHRWGLERSASEAAAIARIERECQRGEIPPRPL